MRVYYRQRLMSCFFYRIYFADNNMDHSINKVLLYSTENYSQYPMINHNGKEYKKKNVYMHN